MSCRRVILPSSNCFSNPAITASMGALLQDSNSLSYVVSGFSRTRSIALCGPPKGGHDAHVDRALAGDALVVVLGSQLLEERHGRGKRRHALDGTVRHVGGGLTAARDRGDVGAL